MITAKIPTVTDLLKEMIEIDTVNEITSGNSFPERKFLELIEKISVDLGFSVERLPIPKEMHSSSHLAFRSTADQGECACSRRDCSGVRESTLAS